MKRVESCVDQQCSKRYKNEDEGLRGKGKGKIEQLI